MKPNKTFRMYCRQFPGLIGNTSINFMHPWCEQVLIKIATVFLAEHPIITENHLNKIIEHVVYVHKSMNKYTYRYSHELNRLNHVSPKHYLEFLQTYINLMGKSLKLAISFCREIEYSECHSYYAVITFQEFTLNSNYSSYCLSILMT